MTVVVGARQREGDSADVEGVQPGQRTELDRCGENDARGQLADEEAGELGKVLAHRQHITPLGVIMKPQHGEAGDKACPALAGHLGAAAHGMQEATGLAGLAEEGPG